MLKKFNKKKKRSGGLTKKMKTSDILTQDFKQYRKKKYKPVDQEIYIEKESEVTYKLENEMKTNHAIKKVKK
jgi:hypothetical protein